MTSVPPPGWRELGRPLEAPGPAPATDQDVLVTASHEHPSRGWRNSVKDAIGPDGGEWRVSRRWATRARFRLPLPRFEPKFDESDLRSLGAQASDTDSLLFGIGVILLVLVVIPLLLFGIELVITGCLIAGGVIGKLTLGRPWVIEARKVAGPGAPRMFTREVSGWRSSRAAVRRLLADIEAGREQ